MHISFRSKIVLVKVASAATALPVFVVGQDATVELSRGPSDE
jgi:hypothetical protein